MQTMNKNLKKIISFIDKHHVLSLASFIDKEIYSCNLFYSFCEDNNSFIVASSQDTQHIQNIKQNSNIAGTIVLETKNISLVQGVQFRGNFLELQDKSLKSKYFKAFPYALAMNPKLWQIKVNYFKMTDNKLGFGKKLIWP
jgi:uncharacterized protein YhbP (UPF0306 family)